MAAERLGVKAKEEDSTSVIRIAEKRGVLRTIHNSPTTDVVEPGIVAKTRTAQQEIGFVANVGWKDISQSFGRRNTSKKEERKKPSATGTPRETPQKW